MTATAALLLAGCVMLAWVITFFVRRSFLAEQIFSIAIYSGPSPLQLRPHPSLPQGAVLTAAQVQDIPAIFVADPFLIRSDDNWFMFFEVLNGQRRLGEIAVASSRDALQWHYGSVVLRENFHLSYPYIFRWQNRILMLPETGDDRSVKLYETRSFPDGWSCVAQLLTGEYRDASMIEFEGRWWLFALRDNRELTLHSATSPMGPWSEHPASPLAVPDAGAARPAGRLVNDNGTLIRFAQDGRISYGREVRAFRILELGESVYREEEIGSTPMLGPGSKGAWNADGMHHVDPQQLTSDAWIASVDGVRIVHRFRWRAGARALANLLGASPRRVSRDSTRA